ncbi:MAG TPA: uroporphyrinogen-III C-methyltransferase, partial [Candidatus Wallbacteria bacterium]|nr:uroporphyrinogen-III C-methyltransferase [Candidatus Wallbacteria bacterium]
MGKKGYVYIVGAGPGDHRLISIKGLESIKKADVIIYDRLVSARLLSYAKPGARLIYAGKASSDHTMRQEDMNVLIADEAAGGNIVCRLKGGDPYIFGRGGEEALLLNERKIPFEIVPGISAFASVPAYAGIPVTHRGYTATAAVITGHEDPAKGASDIDWPKISGIGTLVFFMGVKNLSNICENLIKHGKMPETPAAVIQWGTTSKQRTVTGTLETIDETVKRSGITPPAIFIVSETVRLREKLNWFETLPLFGKKIVVTRAREQASELVLKLEEMGAEVFEFPVIKIVPPDDCYASIDGAIENMDRYGLVVFT